MKARPYADADLEAVAELFTASIHALTVGAYDAKQRAAWAPRPPDLAEWHSRLAGLQVLVAEAEGALAGFIAFTDDGRIDLLYTAPAAARRGVASELYREAEQHLLAAGVTALRTEASLVAAPFFARQGFAVVETQRVLRRGVAFQRHAMHKALES